jgi:16S rRNA processing protein RimM
MARLGKIRGVHGDIYAAVLSAHPGWMLSLDGLQLFPSGARRPMPVKVERLWKYQGRWVLKLAGVDSAAAAEALRGAEIRLPVEKRPPPPDGEVYYEDLVGCEVVERGSNIAVGTVVGWQEAGGQVLLEVLDGSGQEILIPFVPAICTRVDLPARRIEVQLPEGLLELNRTGG